MRGVEQCIYQVHLSVTNNIKENFLFSISLCILLYKHTLWIFLAASDLFTIPHTVGFVLSSYFLPSNKIETKCI